MDERRKLARFDLELPSSIELSDARPAMKKTAFYVHTRDVSSGGAFFPTLETIPAGTRIDVNMVLKTDIFSQETDYPTIKASGYVVRAEPAGIAVCFDSPAQLERWLGHPQAGGSSLDN